MRKVIVQFRLDEGLHVFQTLENPKLHQLIDAYTMLVLRLSGEKVMRAAKALGIGRATLYRRLEEWKERGVVATGSNGAAEMELCSAFCDIPACPKQHGGMEPPAGAGVGGGGSVRPPS